MSDGWMPGVNYAPVRNHAVAGMQRPMRGMTVHHAVGTLASALARFNDPASQASAHFFVEYDGTITQMVSVNDAAYHACQANWSGWVGTENESPPSSSPDVWQGPTPQQVRGNGRILAFLHDSEGVPKQVTDVSYVGGVGYHSMVPGPCASSWGQTGCPGDAFIESREKIVAVATAATPVPYAPPLRRRKTMLQVMIFDTLNVFYVSSDGRIIQKAFAPGKPGADANGWVTALLSDTGFALGGTTMDYQLGFNNDLHLFALGADGYSCKHLTYIFKENRWVTQTV